VNFTSTPTGPLGLSRWLRNIVDTVRTTVIGMSITIKYFFTKPVTYEYPEQRMPVAPRYRGLHYLEQDICIACRVCEKACPIDCIEIRFERHPGNVNEWFEFSLDYNKCMHCELCCYPCPVDCIHMGREYSLVKYDRSELIVDLMTWDGMRDKDHVTIQAAIDKKKKKAEEAAAKKAAQAAKAAADEPSAEDENEGEDEE
jgi:NADH-quinone oxidoreductase chain I